MYSFYYNYWRTNDRRSLKALSILPPLDRLTFIEIRCEMSFAFLFGLYSLQVINDIKELGISCFALLFENGPIYERLGAAFQKKLLCFGLVDVFLDGVVPEDCHDFRNVVALDQPFTQGLHYPQGEVQGVSKPTTKATCLPSWSTIFSRGIDCMGGEQDEIVPNQHTCLDVEIVQEIREEPREDKQKQIHPKRLDLLNNLLEHFIAAFLHHLLHDLHTRIHILEVLAKVPNHQEFLALRQPHEDLVGLQRREPAEQQKSYMKVHALGVADAFVAKCQVFEDVSEMLSVELSDDWKGAIDIQ